MLRFLRVVLFWSHGAFVQGFWSKRVADTEEDKDALRLTRRASRAAREFFFGVVSIGICWCWFFLEKQQWNRMMFAMIWRYYMITHDELWCNVMKFEIWCDVMLWDWKWFDMMSEVYTVCVVKLANYKYIQYITMLCFLHTRAHHHSTMTGTSGFLAQLRLWKRIFPKRHATPQRSLTPCCRTHTEPGGSLCKICVCHRPQIFFVG